MRPIPVLIGLPGAGKSTLAGALAELLGVQVFDSDAFFRECRALAPSCGDPRRVIFNNFLGRVQRLHPHAADAVERDIEATDAQGRCVLQDGQRFREVHGEPVFRSFEIEMLAWAHSTGMIGSNVPDLSASALLYDDNKERFSAAYGYVPVLLDVPHRLVAARVVADYETYAAAKEIGNAITMRGKYELELDKAAAQTRDEEQRAIALIRAARRLTDAFATERLEAYRTCAAIGYSPRPGASPREAARDLLALTSSFRAPKP